MINEDLKTKTEELEKKIEKLESRIKAVIIFLVIISVVICFRWWY